MQKLVFRNSKGVEIDFTSGNYGVVDWNGFSENGLEIQSQKVPFVDGSVYLDSLLNERELAITLAYNDDKDLEKRYRLRREIISVLNPKLGEGTLIYTNDFLSKQIKVIANMPVFPNKNFDEGGTNKADISFVANSPYWEDIEETVINFNSNVIIENNGDVPSLPVINIYSDTENNNVELINTTNRKKIKINGTFKEPITINTQIGKKSINTLKSDYNFIYGFSAQDVFYFKKNVIYAGVNSNLLDVNEYDENNYILLDGVPYVAENGNIIVVCTNTGYIYHSDNIETLAESKTFHNSDGFYKVFYCNEHFFAVTNQNKVYRSDNGDNWVLEGTLAQTVGRIQQLIYSDNNYIAVFANAEIGIYKGTSLTNLSVVYSSTYSLYDIIYNGEMYIAVGSNGYILYSTNLTDWTLSRKGAAGDIMSICYRNGLFTAVGKDGNYSSIIQSYDGINWEYIPFNNDYFALNKIKWIKNKYIATGENWRVIISSPDGVNWSIVSLPVGNLIYFQNKYYSYSNTINYYTTDFKTFTLFNRVSTEMVIIKKVNKYVYYTSSRGDFYRSEDGIHFMTLGHYRFTDYAYAFNKYYSINNNIYVSDDGINFTQISQSEINSITKLVFINNKLFALKYATMYYTDDGVIWNEINEGGTDIVYNNGKYIIYTNDEIKISEDLTNWKIIEATNIVRIVPYNNLFLKYENIDGKCYISISNDGIVWNTSAVINIEANNINYFENKNIYIFNSIGLGQIENKEDTNIINHISADSDLNFPLEIGKNNIIYVNNSKNSLCSIVFKNKYVGV